MPGTIQSHEDTIVALATPPGTGALGLIRLSGPDAITLAQSVFRGKDLRKVASHTIHHGRIIDGDEVVDDALASVFIAPRSYTKEHVVEFSCHGSGYVLQRVLRLLTAAGARLAGPGEFTRRAFLHGAFDLVQAEAVADLIAADTKAAHDTAIKQMRGGVSQKIRQLRERLIHFASMIELELDFAEEDVEFANRDELQALVEEIRDYVARLMDTFDLGNAIKNGVPTVIAGRPNTGKSTLLNTLLSEEKAIVSDIPGTTRDFIEDVIHIDGIAFRFIDTAGIREARDKIEAIGIERTRQKMEEASLIIYLFDLSQETLEEISGEVAKLDKLRIPYLKVGNKTDLAPDALKTALEADYPDMVFISAKQETNIDLLRTRLTGSLHLHDLKAGEPIVTNLRHYEGLRQTKEALDDVVRGIDGALTNDLVALDLRQALHYLGELTGEITTDDLLENIFSKFCIGK